MPGRYGRRYRRAGIGSAWWQERFRGAGFRLTVPRQAILGVFSNTGGHLSAEDVYLKIHKTYPDVGLTTIYRTLDLLVQMGLLFKFDFGDGRARFELFQGPKGMRHHHHLVCTSCGRVIDYTDFIDDEIELLNQIEKGLTEKFNFKITNHLIQFYGLCDRCQNKK